MSFPPLIIFFLFFSFKTSCYVSFFSVIKIDQSFCEEDSHLWLINSWGCEQESPIMWVLSFSLKKKNKNKNRKQKYTDIRTRAHTHTHAHTNKHTHMFLLISMFKSGCFVMVWSTVLFQLNPVWLDSSRALGPTLLGAGEHTHTHKCSDDTLNLLSFIVKMQLELSGHFAYYKCRGHIIL